MINTPPSTVLNFDCKILMKKFPDNYFDLAICDPPYGINVGKMPYLKKKAFRVVGLDGKERKYKNGGFKPKEWDSLPPDQTYFNEVCRVSKEQIIFGAHYTDWIGLGKGSIKWNKMVPDGVSFAKYEYAYCSAIDYQREIVLLWTGMMQAQSLSKPTTAHGNNSLKEKRIHPCQKPVLLYKRLILDYARSGAKILDTHVGSGSSRIAAYDIGCEFHGTEIDLEYFTDQEKRFSTHIEQLRLF